MSYDCCNRITLDEKNNRIKVCVASSNVFPKTYSTWEMCNSGNEEYKDYTWEDKLISLYESLQTGSLQITSINNSTEKIEYALYKTRDWLKENSIDSFEDLFEEKGRVYRKKLLDFANLKESKIEEDWKIFDDWEKEKIKENSSFKNEIKKIKRKLLKESLWEVYGKPFEIFKRALEENFVGDYYLQVFGNSIVTKLGKFNRGYTRVYYGDYNALNCVMAMKMSYKKAYIVKRNMGNDNDIEIVRYLEV